MNLKYAIGRKNLGNRYHTSVVGLLAYCFCLFICCLKYSETLVQDLLRRRQTFHSHYQGTLAKTEIIYP